MKWIFSLLFLYPSISFALESVPAAFKETPSSRGACTNYVNVGHENITQEECSKFGLGDVTGNGRYIRTIKSVRTEAFSFAGYTHRTVYSLQVQDVWNGPFVDAWASSNIYYHTVSKQYSCPPDGNKDFTIGPVDLNGSKVCQKPPKVCLKGAIVRVTSDGKETCVPNCGAAAGLAHSGQYFFQAGPDAGSIAGEVKCYGQCSIQTIGGGVQLSSGAWTGSFTFTGANCSVVRPEPTLDSENNTSSNGDAPPVDNSNTSQGTEDALGDLQGAASGATGTQVQPDATGPNGETTLKDIAKVVADSANAQIKATSEQNVATGKLVSNISKDIQNAIHNSGHGGGGASASLQAQGNGKLDTISDKLGEISDKLDDEKEETPFVPPADSAPFWENVLPDSAFTSIKDKKDSSIQELKDLQSEFSSGLFQTDLTVSGQRPEYDITFNGQNFSAGTFVFDLLLNSGLSAIIFLIATLTAIYIITTRSK